MERMEPMHEEARFQRVTPVAVELGGKVFIGSASDAPKVHSPQGQEDVDAQDSPSSAEEKLPVARNGAEIALRFQVDPQTHQVTVFVLDKTHRHVIRTIPPEEMARLRAGEIIDLFV